jgi:hypothetical protein
MKKKLELEKIKPEIMWAIFGEYGFYIGTWQSKQDAIREHCNDLGKSWEQCKKKGDRAIKVIVSAYLEK